MWDYSLGHQNHGSQVTSEEAVFWFPAVHTHANHAYALLSHAPPGLNLWLLCSQPGTVLIMKGHEDLARTQPPSRVIHPPHPAPKVRYDVNARRTGPSAGSKATAGPEGEFPCKKCGR